MREIVVFGDPVLREETKRVEVFDEELAQLAAEMHRVMVRAPGVGLAAPQVGEPIQMDIIDISVGEDPGQLYVLINPQIIEREGSQKGEEGCLSFPDITTVVERPSRVVVRAQDLTGRVFEKEAEGFLARAFCHEIDHLNGVLMTDRISRIKREIIKKKVEKRVKAGTWHP